MLRMHWQAGDLRNALNKDNCTKLVWNDRGKAVAVDIARGLAFLHANKVIHRDLKSKNVLLTRVRSRCACHHLAPLLPDVLRQPTDSHCRPAVHLLLSCKSGQATSNAAMPDCRLPC
jgi:serine/threonine protein kinase